MVQNGASLFCILILPALFAAGMSLVDATDGMLMLGAYGWAYVKPIRKLYCNLNITLVSVLIAFVVGGIEVMPGEYRRYYTPAGGGAVPAPMNHS